MLSDRTFHRKEFPNSPIPASWFKDRFGKSIQHCS